MPNDSTEEEDPPSVQPFCWWWHPHKTMLDIILGFVMHLTFPLPKFQPPDSNNSDQNDSADQSLSEAQLSHAQTVRNRMDTLYQNHSAFKKWSDRIQMDLCMLNMTIPRNPNIFREWNISQEAYEIPGQSEIPVQVVFPVSLLPNHFSVPTAKNGFSCLELKDTTITLESLPKQIPIIVFFHGGAMTIGSPFMTEAMELLNASQTTEAFVYMSVDYSQAPDAPFPAGPCDACSVVQYVLRRFDHVHVSGASAGGYLALVSGLEACRAQRQEHLRSILSLIPMTDPSTSSDSYVENATSSHFVPTHLLHWSYQVFLGMPNDEDANNNKKSWEQNKWRSSELRRLAEPLYDVPALSNPPKIIIQTNRADPLYLDGKRMIERLRAKNNPVEHVDVRGSHWFGLLFDRASYQKLAQTWKETIFTNGP